MIEKIPLIRACLPYLEKLHQVLFPKWYMLSWAENYAEYEQEVLFLPLLVMPRTVVIDIGAHSGSYVWHLLRLSSDIQAFEPNPTLAAVISAAFPNSVTVHQVALSNRSEAAALQIPFQPNRNAYAPGEARVVPYSSQPRNNKSKCIDIQTKRMDDYAFVNVSFIKIDVEGHELSVLEGAINTLRQNKPNLLVEAEERHSKQAVSSLVSFLEKFDYVGYFLLHGKIHHIRDFRPTMQDIAYVDTCRFGRNRKYINNFIFIHRSKCNDFFEGAQKIVQRVT
jgi:FkbM family methyltransferase